MEGKSFSIITIDGVDYDCLILGTYNLFGRKYVQMYSEYYARENVDKILVYRYTEDGDGNILSIEDIDDDAEMYCVLSDIQNLMDLFECRKNMDEYKMYLHSVSDETIKN